MLHPDTKKKTDWLGVKNHLVTYLLSLRSNSVCPYLFEQSGVKTEQRIRHLLAIQGLVFWRDMIHPVD